MTGSTRWPRSCSGLRRFVAAVAACAAGGIVAPAAAQYASDATPQEFEGVGIEDRTGESIDLGLAFTNERGEPVVLRDLFRPGVPVILTLNYYRCPMLCGATLNGMVDGLEQIDWGAGEQFDILTISFAPEEEWELAAAKKEAYLSRYRREAAADGWHFLVGEPDSIKAITDQTGFGYRFDPTTREYAHTSTIIFLTPEGRISRYMNDVVFAPRDLRLALVEASEGRIGSPLDKFLLFTCFMYDPDANSYAVSALKLMRFGGMLTALVVAGGLLVLWLRSPKAGATVNALGTGS